MKAMPQVSKSLNTFETFNPFRSIPHNEDLEVEVLGTIITDTESFHRVMGVLNEDCFYFDDHKELFKAIKNVFNKNSKITTHLIVEALKKSGKLTLKKNNPYLYLSDIMIKANFSFEFESHVRLLAEYAIRRKLIKISDQIKSDSYNEKLDVFDYVDKSEQAIFDAVKGFISKESKSIKTLGMKKLKVMENPKKGPLGVPSGFTELDNLLDGLRKSNFVVVAARPSMGKTCYLLTIMRNAAVEFGKSVAFFSLEMSEDEVMTRLFAQESGISTRKIERGNLDEEEWAKLYSTTAKLTEASIHIDDTPALTLLDLKSKARRLKDKAEIDMIIVDYLQLMSGDTRRSPFAFQQNREQEIATISRGLKQLAKELDIIVIAASQLSRAVETRGGDKRPQLSDLRESGAIEQDVDIAMFLYRPEYYGIMEDSIGNPTNNITEIIVSKNRHGATGKATIKFEATLTKFSNF